MQIDEGDVLKHKEVLLMPCILDLSMTFSEEKWTRKLDYTIYNIS